MSYGIDDEPSLGLVECLARTTTTGGLVPVSFTPLDGVNKGAASFLDRQSSQVRSGSKCPR